MNLFLQNLRYGLRQFGKNPASMLVIILTLGIGIAVNDIFVGVINEFYFRPLPAHKPEQLAVMAQSGSQIQFNIPLSYADAADLRRFVEGSDTVVPDMANVFSGLMAYKQQVVHLSRPEHSTERAFVDAVTDNYFSVLGVQPHLGRFFTPEEVKEPGSQPVIVLSYKTWQDQFDADPKVIGSTVNLNSIVFTVIGVTREEFIGATWGTKLNGFVPITMLTKLENRWVLNRGNSTVFLMGRIQPRITMDQIRAACDVAYARLNNENPEMYMPNSRLVVMRESQSRPSPYIAQHTPKIVAALSVMGALVLMVALFNATGLLYARSMNRERELAIRAAIGASRFQLTKQILIESILFSLAAGVFGILLAQLAGPGLMALMPAPDVGAPPLIPTPDWRPFVFTGLIALVVGLLAGLMPALKASGISPLASMRKEGGGIVAAKNRLRNVLIAGQLVFSILVLSVAAMAVRSAVLLAHADLGFQKENLHLVSFDLGAQKYKMKRARKFRADLLERVRVLPGIESVGLTSAAPLAVNQGMLGGIRAEETSNPDEYTSMVPTLSVEPGYLETLGMRRIAGRCFTVHDDVEAPKVAIINSVLAELLWPDQEAVGQRINIQGKVAEVVGVVDVKRHYNVTDTHRSLLIVPLEQRYSGSLTLVVRTLEGVPSPMPSVTDVVRSLDPDLPLFSQKTMGEQIVETPNGLMPFRAGAILAGVQGGIALLLVSAGIFGQVAFSVSRRTREIGLRIALGSSKLRVIDAVTRGVAILTAVSLVVGLGLAYGISRLLRNFLYGSGQGDALLFGGVGLLIATAVVLACWLPVRRALRVDPMDALRFE